MRSLFLIVALLAGAPALAQGQATSHWTCVDAAGKTVATDEPCPAGTQQIAAGAKVRASLATVQPRADWRSNGIPLWVWGIVGVLTIAWIWFLLPPDLFTPKAKAAPLPPVVFTPPPPKPAPPATVSRPAVVTAPADPKPAAPVPASAPAAAATNTPAAPVAPPPAPAPVSRSAAITAPSMPAVTIAPPSEPMPALAMPAANAVSTPIESWTPELISGLTLNKLETLVQRFWHARGCEVSRDRASDGGIQFLVARPGVAKLFALAQCAPTKGEKIGLAAVKALASEGVLKGAGITMFYSLPGFTDEALAFVKDKPIKLISIPALLHDIGLMPPMHQQRLLEQTLITSGPTLARP